MKALFRGHFDNLREDCLAACFEFIGTTFFLLFGLGGIQAANAATTMQGRSSSVIEQVLYISTSMGLSLLVSAWLFFRVTGGLFNPDVSLALLLIGALPPVRFVLYCIAQLVGAIAASAILYGLTPGELVFNNFLQEGVNKAQGVFIEMFITEPKISQDPALFRLRGLFYDGLIAELLTSISESVCLFRSTAGLAELGLYGRARRGRNL